MLLTGKGNDKNDSDVDKEELEVSQVAENLERRWGDKSYTATDDSIYRSAAFTHTSQTSVSHEGGRLSNALSNLYS